MVNLSHESCGLANLNSQCCTHCKVSMQSYELYYNNTIIFQRKIGILFFYTNTFTFGAGSTKQRYNLVDKKANYTDTQH